jgi:hypothetical protein
VVDGDGGDAAILVGFEGGSDFVGHWASHRWSDIGEDSGAAA